MVENQVKRIADLCKQWSNESNTNKTDNYTYADGFYEGQARAFAMVAEMLELALKESK